MKPKRADELPAGDDEPSESVPESPPPDVRPGTPPLKPGMTAFFVDSPAGREESGRPHVLGHQATIHRQIDAFLATLPRDAAYGDKVQQIEDFGNAVNGRVTVYISEAIKLELANRPSSSYPEKLAVTRWFSGELRRFNMVIRSAKIGGVATLSADKDGLGGGGRFKLKAKAKPQDGRPSNFNTTKVAELLTDIELIEAPHRREGLQKDRAKDALPEGPTTA